MYDIVNKNSNYSVEPNVKVVGCFNTTDAMTVTLPAASAYKNRFIWIKRYDTNSVGLITITSVSGNVQSPYTSAHDSSTVIGQDIKGLGYYSDGSLWHLLDFVRSQSMRSVTKNAAATLTLDDMGAHILMNASSSNNVTIPSGMPPGSEFWVTQFTTSRTSVLAGAGVTLVSNGNKFKIVGQYGVVKLFHHGADIWIMSGDRVV